MKQLFGLLFIILSTAAVSYAGLQDDLDEIAALVPHDDLKNLTSFYWRNDAGVRRVFKYTAFSKIALRAHREIAGDADIKALAKWVRKHLKKPALFDEYETINDYLGNPELLCPTGNHSLGGFPTYINKVYELVPHDEILELIKSKIDSTGDLAELYELIKEHRDTYERLVGLRSVRQHIRLLKWLRVDVDAFDRFVRKAFGWTDEPVLFA